MPPVPGNPMISMVGAVKKAEIHPVWTRDKEPKFFQRSTTQFMREPWEPFFQKRGIHSPILSSLVTCLPPGAIIAGGFVSAIFNTQSPAHDIDIFFTSQESFERTYELFANPPSEDKFWVVREYALSVSPEDLLNKSRQIKLVQLNSPNKERMPIQLIKMIWFNDAEHVIDSFDYTVCQVAIDGKDLVYSPGALMDLCQRRLVLHRFHYPGDALYRLTKYTQKGYSVIPATLLELVADIRDCSITDPPMIGKFYG
jgi:hypothetical protein